MHLLGHLATAAVGVAIAGMLTAAAPDPAKEFLLECNTNNPSTSDQGESWVDAKAFITSDGKVHWAGANLINPPATNPGAASVKVTLHQLVSGEHVGVLTGRHEDRDGGTPEFCYATQVLPEVTEENVTPRAGGATWHHKRTGGGYTTSYITAWPH